MIYTVTADNVMYKGKRIDDRYLEKKLGNAEYKERTFTSLPRARAYAYRKVNLIKGAKVPCEVGSNETMNGWVYIENGYTVWNDYDTGVEKILNPDGTLGKKIGSAPWWA